MTAMCQLALHDEDVARFAVTECRATTRRDDLRYLVLRARTRIDCRDHGRFDRLRNGDGMIGATPAAFTRRKASSIVGDGGTADATIWSTNSRMRSMAIGAS